MNRQDSNIVTQAEVDHYIALATEYRNQYIKEQFSQLVKNIKERFHGMTARVSTSHRYPGHIRVASRRVQCSGRPVR